MDLTKMLLNRAFKKTNVTTRYDLQRRLPFMNGAETNELLKIWEKDGDVIIQNHGWRIYRKETTLLK